MRIPRHSVFPHSCHGTDEKKEKKNHKPYKAKTHCWKIKCLLLFFICDFLSGWFNPARCLMSLKREEVGEKSRMAAGGGGSDAAAVVCHRHH